MQRFERKCGRLNGPVGATYPAMAACTALCASERHMMESAEEAATLRIMWPGSTSAGKKKEREGNRRRGRGK